MQKRLIITIGIVIFLAIILGGVFLWMQKSPAPMTNIQSNSNIQNSNDQAANWKTYKNDEYGFEIMLPSDYETIGPVSGPINGQVGFAFQDKSEKSDLKNTFSININPTYPSLDSKRIVSGPITTLVDGISAQHYKIKWIWEGNNKEYILDYVEVKKDNRYYIFSDFGLTSDTIPFEEILSTFKFTN